MAFSGSSAAISTIDSSLVSISSVELACPVESEPSWPVFMAVSMSRASAPLTSPTIILSGLILKAALISIAMLISPSPSKLASLVSRLTRFGMCLILSSAESSMVIILSSGGMYWVRALRNVDLPEPVPPEIKML